MRLATLLAATALATGSGAALAQVESEPAKTAAPAPTRGSDHLHDTRPGDIVVTADFVKELNLLAGTNVLTGANLVRDIRPQIGDTLAKLPGVSATSFSPGASRPVLRGFQGERIRVLTDGIGSIDVSNTSADHAVTIDPLTAERIEVLHGPAVLLFGSQAIGGAVNVLDRRIPRQVPDEFAHVDGLASYGSAADERSVGASADFPLGGGVVAHVDGSYRKSDDLRVGGFVLSPELRAEQRAIAAEEAEEGHAEEAAEATRLANLRGKLPDSATETTTVGGGIAIIRDRGSLGFSVGYYDSNYGVPSRPGAGHHHGEEEGEDEDGHDHGEESVSIGMKQFRFDARGELEVGGGFVDKLRVRIGAADYKHTEFEGDEVGTVFRNQGFEGRFEAVQADRGGWRGVTGAQYYSRDFSATGAEAFLPPNQTSQTGLFTLQEFDLGAFGLEAAARYEHTDVAASSVGVDRNYNAFSAAIGGSYELSPQVKAGINLSRAARAPSAEELFSNGPHVATQSFEVGDPNLRTERSWGGEIYLRAQRPTWSFSAAAFASWFDNYIYQAATGEEDDELPVFQYFQRDATYYGFEMQGSAKLFDMGRFSIQADGVADYVRATVDEAGPVPRIPPLRLLGGVEAQSDNIDGRVEVEWVDSQKRTADFENPTDGYTMVNASVAWRPWGRENPTSIILSANNIFDVEARRHASFTKDFVPLGGRDLRASLRVSF
ncbi:TonB-dependent receptor [Allosphingosinicella indica]|uniref:Iron complex outermembrane recepter protein n=1 Tax=Allosphingosinicella indica TaxID=941907 RepID=A0A1X7H0A6_9SPHN|nr:TonB-dependent receptor [Allosphingosinicella indica]SMF77348.1 iron complex outermembrane recepter protein [Allosphingosinicella indica]